VLFRSQNLKYLQVLDLSYNNITHIEGLDDLPIQELNLRGNSLNTLEGLSNLPYLSSLDVSENHIACLAPLDSCFQLHYLNVQSNQLTHIRQVEFLRELQWLMVLLVDGNPAAKKHFYRLRVIYLLPKLSHLDNVRVSAEEKVLAMNLKRSDGGDTELRASVFSRYFPEEQFVDYSSILDDDELELTVEDLLGDKGQQFAEAFAQEGGKSRGGNHDKEDMALGRPEALDHVNELYVSAPVSDEQMEEEVIHDFDHSEPVSPTYSPQSHSPGGGSRAMSPFH